MRQGRTDAWIAHQLEVPVSQIQAFKRENALEPETAGDGQSFDEEVDLRAEDDAAIAAALEEEEEAKRKAEEEEAARKRAEEAKAAEEKKAKEPEAGEKPKRTRKRAAKKDAEEPEEEPAAKPRARRTRKRAAGPQTFEATFDHGEEGYGLWLDPAIQEDAIYAEHWAGHRPIEVTIEEDQIVIKRS